MDKREIIDLLKSEKGQLYQRFGLLRIGLFGSYSTDSQDSESDVDLLVELREARFDYLAGLQIYLEERLGQPVDVIRKRKGLSDRFLNRIEKDIIYV